MVAKWALLALGVLARGGFGQEAEALDRLIQKRMDDVGLMGLAGMVIADGNVVWAKGFGFRDARRTQPFTVQTPMQVASITKTMTGVAMMQLVAEGRLSLDADINGYLPFRVRNPRFPEAPITLRMLATHTSSITDRWEVYRNVYRFGGGAMEPLSQFLAGYFAPGGALYAEGNFLTSAPGSEREYSNMGASLAGYIVERAAGERLDKFTKRRILAPLGMKLSEWSMGGVPGREVSTLFVAQNGMTVPIPHYAVTTYPDGGLRAPVEDLAKFFLALLNRGVREGVRILPEREADEMLRFQFNGPAYPKGYGPGEGNSGLFWRTKFGGARMGHGGNDPGVQAEMLASLDRKVAVILLCNTSVSGAEGRAFGEILQALWKLGESRVQAGR